MAQEWTYHVFNDNSREIISEGAVKGNLDEVRKELMRFCRYTKAGKGYKDIRVNIYKGQRTTQNSLVGQLADLGEDGSAILWINPENGKGTTVNKDGTLGIEL